MQLAQAKKRQVYNLKIVCSSPDTDRAERSRGHPSRPRPRNAEPGATWQHLPSPLPRSHQLPPGAAPGSATVPRAGLAGQGLAQHRPAGLQAARERSLWSVLRHRPPQAAPPRPQARARARPRPWPRRPGATERPLGGRRGAGAAGRAEGRCGGGAPGRHATRRGGGRSRGRAPAVPPAATPPRLASPRVPDSGRARRRSGGEPTG